MVTLGRRAMMLLDYQSFSVCLNTSTSGSVVDSIKESRIKMDYSDS